jgi:hypothetical protein
MIIDFTVENYGPFRDRNTLSLIAAPNRGKTDQELERANVIPINDRLSLLRAAAIYGPNASGKSRLIEAFSDFREAILASSDSDFHFEMYPFQLNTSSMEKPVVLELRFLLEGIPYRYGFSVREETVAGEWLYVSRSAWETTLFEREGNALERNRNFREGTAFLEGNTLTNPEALFLTQCSKSRGGELSKTIVTFMRERTDAISGLHEEGLRRFTIESLEKGHYRQEILKLIKEADVGISNLRLAEEDEAKNLLDNVKRAENQGEQIISDLRLQAEHPVFDAGNKQIGKMEFPFALAESQGTQKLFAFAGPILDTLHKGNTLFVDEIDAKLHPLLTRAIISLFQSEETNPHGAQLVFVTHDTNLLHSNPFRRDQIWFTEKDRYGASQLYSLAEFKKTERKGADLERDYMDGRFGAVPFLGDWSRLLEETPTKSEDSN